MGFDGDHFGIYTFGKFTIDVLQVAGLTAPAGTIIDDLNLDFFILQIYKGHQNELEY
jgi:hypothetical protein